MKDMRSRNMVVADTCLPDVSLAYKGRRGRLQMIYMESCDEDDLRHILNHRHDFRMGIKDVAEFSSDKDRISYYIFISMPIKFISPLLERRSLKWFQERWGVE